MLGRLAGLISVIGVIGFVTVLNGCGGHPAAPDASSEPRIAYVHGDGVFLLKPGGRRRYLTQGDDPAWSRGHRTLAITRADFNLTPPANEVWLVRAAGGVARRVTSVYPKQVRFFALTPSGRRLA